MGHHGSDPFESDDPERRKQLEKLTDSLKAEGLKSREQRLRELLDTTGFRGALGDFPEGQLTKSDEGAILFAIGIEKGKVVLDFGKQVHWVGMTPQQAADLGSLLLKRAREAARKNGETVSFVIS